MTLDNFKILLIKLSHLKLSHMWILYIYNGLPKHKCGSKLPKMGMHLFPVLSLSLLTIYLSFCSSQPNTTFQVGVILDVNSLVGRIGLTSLSLALSDFYSSNSNYSTRLALHIRDSRGLVTGAAASGIFSFQFCYISAMS